MSSQPTVPDSDPTEAVLTDPSLVAVVDTVVRRSHDGYRAASTSGAVEFRRTGDGIEILAEEGDNPLRNQRTDERVALADEEAEPWNRLGDHSTPYAMESIAQYFDSAHAPDVAIMHSPTHRFHGNAGEHGSLGASQARGPLIAAGPGIAARGVVPEHLRGVDVAPTLAALMGLPPIQGHDGLGNPRSNTRLRVQDGQECRELLDPDTRPDHVVVFLWDGVNINTLHDEAASGSAPNVAALIERGTSYRHGALASLPTATLGNHMTQSTGVLPGRSGVLHNTWYDRTNRKVIDLLDLAQMISARDYLRTDIETLHEAVHRVDPTARTATTYEYGDRGADFSTYALMSEGKPVPVGTDEEKRRHRTAEFMDHPQYHLMSAVDGHSISQARRIWRSELGSLPRFSWFTLNLPDAAGHANGPASEMARAAIHDTDARMGDAIEEIERSGAIGRTAIVLLADHGMQQIAGGESVDLSLVLKDAGVSHQMIDKQYVYLT